jgi:hypothetical protein
VSETGSISGPSGSGTDSSHTLREKIFEAINDLVSLKVTTTVNIGATPKSIVTTINLLEGDITTVMDDDFVSGPYQSLREFHQKREDQGQAIINGNVEALKSLLDLFNRTQPPAVSAG